MTENSPIFRAEIALPDMAATKRLAGRIAPLLTRGDAVALWGDLGAGKTALAREILRSLGVAEDVPSPTFTLVQTYETAGLNVAHYDLYRLKSSDELFELGFQEALEDGAALVEWPERAPEHLPPDALHLRLRIEDGARMVKVTGPSRWKEIA